MHIRSQEAQADAEHTRRLAFVQQGAHILVSQLNTEMTAYRAKAELFQTTLLRSETDCYDERQAALGLTSQNMSLTTHTLHFETALKHNGLQTAQLRRSFDDSRSWLLEYVTLEFED